MTKRKVIEARKQKKLQLKKEGIPSKYEQKRKSLYKAMRCPVDGTVCTMTYPCDECELMY